MLLIDKYAYFNGLQTVHPVEKLTLSLVLLVFSLVVKDSLVSLVTFLWMSGLTVFAANIPISYYMKLLFLPVFFLLSGMVTILVSFTDGQPVIVNAIWSIHLGSLQLFISKSNLRQVVNLFFVVLGSISCLYFLTLTTPMTAILGIMRKLKLSPLLIELIVLTYRFIFVLSEIAVMIHKTQSSRLGYMTIRQGIKSLGQMVSTLFVKSFQRSNQLTIAMDSRCYENEIVFLEKTYAYSFKNWIVIFVIVTAIIGVYLQFGGIL